MARTTRHQPRGTGSFCFMLALVALLTALIAMTGFDLAERTAYTMRFDTRTAGHASLSAGLFNRQSQASDAPFPTL